MGRLTRRHMDIRDAGTLLQFALLAVSLPALLLCGLWLVHRMQKGRDGK